MILREGAMESYISISFLNDFIFCPRSIYFHNLYKSFDTSMYHESVQTKGRIAHKNIDEKKYSTKKNILQGIPIYSFQYSLYGRLDLFDKDQGLLTERKKKVHKIYDGFIFQIYAQYYCLIEMGYTTKKLCIYSLDDNKNYEIALPSENKEMDIKFKKLIEEIKNYNLEKSFYPNASKCQKCIYKNLCDRSLAC